MTVQSLDLATILPAITSSTVLLYPTDTIYGLGGLVTPEIVEKIMHIKQRPTDRPFSIIAPSFDRVSNHFAVTSNFSEARTHRKQQFP
jgi:tRNA A37 threonylcarbamoyladenosine synthetase subunit TsaC/SUA5/YrdC